MELISDIVKNADFRKIHLDDSYENKNVWNFNWYSSKKLNSDTILTITTDKKGFIKFCSFKNGEKYLKYFSAKQISLFTKFSLALHFSKLKNNLINYPLKDSIFEDYFKNINHFEISNDPQHVEEIEWDGEITSFPLKF